MLAPMVCPRVTSQCRFIVLAMQEAYHGDEFLQDAVVDFVVTVYPRIVSSAKADSEAFTFFPLPV